VARPDTSAGADVVALLRESMEATNRRDFDAAMRVFAPDAVFEVSAGVGPFEGRAAVRGYLEDWVGTYEQQRFGEWDGEDLGNGVVLVLARLDARLAGSEATVRERWAFIVVWAAGAIVRVIADSDIEHARAAAARLAADRA
jgi:ketosteroid isomerase-like protein